MAIKQRNGHYYYTDDYDKDFEPIDLTLLYGSGNEPRDSEQVRKLIKEKNGFFGA